MLNHAQTRDDLRVELVDLRDHPLPFFAEVASNIHTPSKDPDTVCWQERIAGFDGFIFVVAECNHSLTAPLKNALDQTCKEWNRKLFTAIAYGGAGEVRALAPLRGIGVERQIVSTRSAVHIGGSDFNSGVPDGRERADRERPIAGSQGGAGRTRLVDESNNGSKGGERLRAVRLDENEVSGTVIAHALRKTKPPRNETR